MKSPVPGSGTGDFHGIYFRMNFDKLNDFASDWLKLVLENKDIVFKDNEFAAEEFEDGAAKAAKALQLARVLQSFDYNKYQTETDEARSSWHLRLKDVE